MTFSRRRALPLLLSIAAAMACANLTSAVAAADDWTDAKGTGVLRWGGDTEGGGPYIFPDENDPEKNIGFEIELMDAVARFLHLKAEFNQAQWDKLPDMLRGKKVPVIANGLEFTAERVDVMDATIPYYVYGLQLLCPKRANGCTSWNDLKQARDGKKQKVGVLTGSAAETESRNFCGEACEVITYDGNTDSMREVETGKLDATVQDTPIAAFYGPRFPQLVAVADPIAPGYYVMYVRKGEAALLRKLNEALVVLTRSGEFERICRKYGIWNKQQAELAAIHANARFFGLYNAVAASGGVRADAAGPDAAAPATATDLARDPSATTPTAADATMTTAAAGPAPPIADVTKVDTSTRKRGWAVVEAYTPIFIKSAGMTVVLSVLSFPLAILLGLLVAVGRLYGPRPARLLLGAYVEFIRGTPMMLQLYFIFFFLPEVGVNIDPFTTAIMGLAINYSAYESEIYRAGLQSVPPGQMEAALSLGMSRTQALRRIIVPQAIRMVIPPVVSDFIALFKDTSVCSVVTIVELTKRFTVLSQSTQATVELMAMTAVLYLLMSYPLSVAARRIEKRLGVGQHLST